MDLFGIKARRKAKREEQERCRNLQIRIEKAWYQARKKNIDTFLEEEQKRQASEIDNIYENNKRITDEHNSICPKCGSKNVINLIKRTKGEINGSFAEYTNSSSGILYSSHTCSKHSNLKGDNDTFPINKCKDCENEWNVEEPEKPVEYNPFSAYGSLEPSYLYRRICEYIEMKYDPDDIKNECNSLDEMRVKLCEKTKNALKCYRRVPKYVMDYVLYNAFNEILLYFIETRYDLIEKYFGQVEGKDKYSYQMPDDIWKIAKKLIDIDDIEYLNSF